MHRPSLRSPDSRHEARLFRLDDIRFGPTYYRLELDDWSFDGRAFGRSYLWSPDSRRFFVQEWLSTESSCGPDTVLIAIDPITGKSETVAHFEGGFVEPLEYRDDHIVFQKRIGSEREVVEQRFETCSSKSDSSTTRCN